MRKPIPKIFARQFRYLWLWAAICVPAQSKTPSLEPPNVDTKLCQSGLMVRKFVDQNVSNLTNLVNAQLLEGGQGWSECLSEFFGRVISALPVVDTVIDVSVIGGKQDGPKNGKCTGYDDFEHFVWRWRWWLFGTWWAYVLIVVFSNRTEVANDENSAPPSQI